MALSVKALPFSQELYRTAPANLTALRCDTGLKSWLVRVRQMADCKGFAQE